MKYLFPLVATSNDGTSILLYSIVQFEEFARVHDIGERFLKSVLCYDREAGGYRRVPKPSEWIVRDDRGRVVMPGSFEKPTSLNWKKRHRNRRGDFEFRNGPVPNVFSCSRHGRCSHGARKRRGGRGVAARNAAFHSGRIDVTTE